MIKNLRAQRSVCTTLLQVDMRHQIHYYGIRLVRLILFFFSISNFFLTIPKGANFYLFESTLLKGVKLGITVVLKVGEVLIKLR